MWVGGAPRGPAGAVRGVRSRVPRDDAQHWCYGPALAGVWNTLGWIMNRKNTVRRRRRWTPRTNRHTGGFNPGPAKPCSSLAKGHYRCVRASGCSVWSAVPNGPRTGMPRQRISRESFKRNKKGEERNEAESQAGSVMHDEGLFARKRNRAVATRLVNLPITRIECIRGD